MNGDLEAAGDEEAVPDADPVPEGDVLPDEDEVLDDSQLFGPVIAWRHACRPRSSLPFRSSLLPSPAAAAPSPAAARKPSRPLEVALPELALPEPGVSEPGEMTLSARVASPPAAVLPKVLTSGRVRPI